MNAGMEIGRTNQDVLAEPRSIKEIDKYTIALAKYRRQKYVIKQLENQLEKEYEILDKALLKLNSARNALKRYGADYFDEIELKKEGN